MMQGKSISHLLYTDNSLTEEMYTVESALRILEAIPDTEIDDNIETALITVFKGKEEVPLSDLKDVLMKTLGLPESVYELVLMKTKGNPDSFITVR